MKNALILSALLTLGPVCMAQQAEKYPLGDYQELTDTKPHDGEEVWNQLASPTSLSWGSINERYQKEVSRKSKKQACGKRKLGKVSASTPRLYCGQKKTLRMPPSP